MNKFEKCRTCVNNRNAYGGTFCNICERADMYKEDPVRKYCSEDVAITAKLAHMFTDYTKYSAKTTLPITNVIFAPPATIVFWNDGTKTVVKCDNEAYDPEKGLAMAISKRALGNKGNYFETFKKWVDPYVEKQAAEKKKIEEIEKMRWSIWFRTFDADTGKVNGEGVYHKTYKRLGDATRIAKQVYGDTENVEYIVARMNPWVKN